MIDSEPLSSHSGPSPKPTVRSRSFVESLPLALLFILSVILFSQLSQFWPSPFPERRRTASTCLYNLRKIGLALQSFASVNGHLPPAYVADANGKPLYSWRVMIVGYLGRNDIAEQFHWDEAWNSPHNRQFIKRMPEVFLCPDAHASNPNCTNYLAITGPGTVFEGTKRCRHEEITDGLDMTLMVAETADSDIVWTEPRDLPLGTLNLKIDSDRKGISSDHGRQPSGANILFCDAHAGFVSYAVSPETVRALCTIHGGEPIGHNDF